MRILKGDRKPIFTAASAQQGSGVSARAGRGVNLI
ncbi:hypothetical protein [Blastomonas sp. CACIA14H2]